MPDRRSEVVEPSRKRLIVATLIVILVVIAVWKFIDYRTQPPPPPHQVATPAQTP
jgi:hypothetical protein